MLFCLSCSESVNCLFPLTCKKIMPLCKQEYNKYAFLRHKEQDTSVNITIRLYYY